MIFPQFLDDSHQKHCMLTNLPIQQALTTLSTDAYVCMRTDTLPDGGCNLETLKPEILKTIYLQIPQGPWKKLNCESTGFRLANLMAYFFPL